MSEKSEIDYDKITGLAFSWIDDGEEHSLVFLKPEKIKGLINDDAITLGAFLRAAIAQDESVMPLPDDAEAVGDPPQLEPAEIAISTTCESCDTHVYLGTVAAALLTDPLKPGQRAGKADSKLFDEIFSLPKGWARVGGHTFCSTCKDNPRIAIKWACDGTCEPRATAIAGHIPLDVAIKMEHEPVELDGRTVGKLDPSAHVGTLPEGWTQENGKQFCPACSEVS